MEEYIITFTTIDNHIQTQLCQTKEEFDFNWQSYDEREDKLSLSFETIQTTGSI
jgi:hypothetical protein